MSEINRTAFACK